MFTRANADTDVVVCFACDAPYMIEFVHAVAGDAPVNIVTLHTPAFVDASKRYICFRRVCRPLLPPAAHVLFINTEQLSVPHKMAEFKEFTACTDNLEVYDYSLENVALANGISKHLPIVEHAAETAASRAHMAARPARHPFDVACVGTVTVHRIRLIEALTKRGIRIDFIQGFGEERDRRTGACKVLLNLHAGPTYEMYEPIRCERWRHAGLPIVSETCRDAVPTGIMQASKDLDVDALASMLVALVAATS
jgi:hypothetical protein